MMKNRNFENKLAWIGALVVLVGVSSAATTAFAAEPSDSVTTTLAAKRTDAVAETIIGARKANAEAAAEAAAALRTKTTLELDIQLGDLSSTLIARNK